MVYFHYHIIIQISMIKFFLEKGQVDKITIQLSSSSKVL